LLGQLSFLRMVWVIKYLSVLERKSACVLGHKVFMEVNVYFTDCWLSTRDFMRAAQASPSSLIKY
jgi:hypothetical protein